MAAVQTFFSQWAPKYVTAAILLLVCMRSFVFLIFPQSHFDSDQAIVGLMALDLAQGQGFPLFFYGQRYMLGVEAWLAAPLFAIFGPSVLLLKLPLLVINFLVAVLLVRLLVRELKLSYPMALAGGIFFIFPPIVTASRLVEAQGGNIEPFLYVLLLWIVRHRPIMTGLIAGFGILNREFTAYALVGLVMLQFMEGSLFRGKALKYWATVACSGVLVFAAVHAFQPLSLNNFGGGPPEPRLKSIEEMWSDWYYVRNYHLPALFGLERVRLSEFFITSSLRSTIHVLPKILKLLLLAGLGVFVLSLFSGRARSFLRERPFVCYLLVVAILPILVNVIASPVVKTLLLIRYNLLVLFLPVAIIAFAASIVPEGCKRLRGLVLVIPALWFLTHLLPHARLVNEYLWHRPDDRFELLADALLERGYSEGRAPYHTAYVLTFVSGKRLLVDTEPWRRINYPHPFEPQFSLADDSVCMGGEQIQGLCLVDLRSGPTSSVIRSDILVKGHRSR